MTNLFLKYTQTKSKNNMIISLIIVIGIYIIDLIIKYNVNNVEKFTTYDENYNITFKGRFSIVNLFK
jgi:hypothetical protein